MASGPPDKAGLDASALAEARETYAFAKQRLEPDHVRDLASEVVKRLAFRMPRTGDANAMPTPAEISRICAALLSSDEGAAERIIFAARKQGAEIETIYLGYVAEASRRLGEMWNADEVSFADVSLATGRLYQIIRGLRHVLGPVILEGRARMPALFALVPGETHTLGIEMAADLFRRDGGDADVCINRTHDEIVALCEKNVYGVVVLSAHSDRSLPELARLAVAIRIMQPLTSIALAGQIATDPDVQKMIGAELVITDYKVAGAELRRLTKGALAD